MTEIDKSNRYVDKFNFCCIFTDLLPSLTEVLYLYIHSNINQVIYCQQTGELTLDSKEHSYFFYLFSFSFQLSIFCNIQWWQVFWIRCNFNLYDLVPSILLCTSIRQQVSMDLLPRSISVPSTVFHRSVCYFHFKSGVIPNRFSPDLFFHTFYRL